MDYSEYTFRDKNFFKRFLQKKRVDLAYNSGLKTQKKQKISILDYGCGNAELYKFLDHTAKTFSYVGWDPSDALIEEAERNLKSTSGEYTLTTNRNGLKKAHYDLIFSLEVFEHLPDPVIEKELQTMEGLLNNNGVLIIQVPNEIFLSAFVRGSFRMYRRYGTYDANIKNVFRAVIGSPPKDRYLMFNESSTFINSHMGFDHRQLIKKIEKVFKIEEVFGGPVPFLPVVFNTE